jgi:hypothetical protein
VALRLQPDDIAFAKGVLSNCFGKSAVLGAHVALYGEVGPIGSLGAYQETEERHKVTLLSCQKKSRMTQSCTCRALGVALNLHSCHGYEGLDWKPTLR